MKTHCFWKKTLFGKSFFLHLFRKANLKNTNCFLKAIYFTAKSTKFNKALASKM